MQLVFLSRHPDVHHQIALVSGRPETLAFNPINQISLSVPDLASLRRYHDRLMAAGATDMQPATHGNAVSLYCRNPEGNRLEVFMDTPWYCDQPLREPIDGQSDASVIAQAEAIARRAPKFMTTGAAQRMAPSRIDFRPSGLRRMGGGSLPLCPKTVKMA